MNLVYLVFGNNIEIHKQATFSILTFLARDSELLNNVVVLTDSPQFYTHLIPSKVSIEAIDSTLLEQWQGPYRFFWRVKIKALEHVAHLFPDQSLLYLDADTFLFKNMAAIKSCLDSGQNLMHLNEGKLSGIKSKTASKMWKQINAKQFGGVMMNANHCMWNAGVIGISKANFKENIPLALAICDEMCEQKVTPRLIEQFAFSVALSEKTQLLAADSWIGHYWGNKKAWNQLIAKFFLEPNEEILKTENQINKVRNINFSALPVIIKYPNTHFRPLKILAKFFPSKFSIYIKD